MDQHISEELLSVLREALSNVAQHADAQAARVAVDVGAVVVLTVSDDGVGVPEEVIGARKVANMFERAHRLGGDAGIANHRSGGAVLTWRVPREAPTMTASNQRLDLAHASDPHPAR